MESLYHQKKNEGSLTFQIIKVLKIFNFKVPIFFHFSCAHLKPFFHLAMAPKSESIWQKSSAREVGPSVVFRSWKLDWAETGVTIPKTLPWRLPPETVWLLFFSDLERKRTIFSKKVTFHKKISFFQQKNRILST